MDVSNNQSPIKHQQHSLSSPMNRSLIQKNNLFKMKISQNDINTLERPRININQLGAKIQGMEKRLRDRQFLSPTQMRGSVGTGLEIRIPKIIEGNKNVEKDSKNNCLTKQQLRSSWNQNIVKYSKQQPKTQKINQNKNINFNLLHVGYMGGKVNQQNLNRSASKIERLQIPLIDGLSQKDQQKRNNSFRNWDKYTSTKQKNIKDMMLTKYKSNEEEIVMNKDEKYRNSINKSMEVLNLIKNIDLNKTRKQKKSRIFTISTTVIQGFSFGQVLGKGKFGEVYMARHVETGFIVAIKKVAKKKLQQFGMIDQFIKEIKLHNSLDHPKIVKFYGFFQQKQDIYLVIEYMNGGTLFDYLNIMDTLGIKQALQFLKDVIEGMIYMHERSIAHRDIKPQNIVISSSGVAKLCDFGWAALVDSVRSTYCGTLDYASPEILERKKYDLSVDVWSIGILTYEMLMGKAPFQDKDRTVVKFKILRADSINLQYSEKVPVEARQFIQSLVQKDPSKRPKITQLLEHKLFEKYGPKNAKKLV